MNMYCTPVNREWIFLYLSHYYSNSNGAVGSNGNGAAGSSEPFDKLPSDKAFEMIYALRLTEEQLVANGFPRPGNRAGVAVIQNTGKPIRILNETERYCGRCGKLFSLLMYEETYVDQCNYHPKGTGFKRGKKELIQLN